MPDLYTWYAHEYKGNDGIGRVFGSLDLPTILSGFSGAPPLEIGTSLATNATATLWANTGIPADFLYGVLISDQGDSTNGFVMVELTTDLNASIGKEQYTVGLRAGIPFIIPCSSSYANYTDNFGGGTLDHIEQIRVKNLNTSTANVTLWLIL